MKYYITRTSGANGQNSFRDTPARFWVEIEDVQVNANIRWSCEKQKYMQIIIQNYNDNLHEHRNQKNIIIIAWTLHETRQK